MIRLEGAKRKIRQISKMKLEISVKNNKMTNKLVKVGRKRIDTFQK